MNTCCREVADARFNGFVGENLYVPDGRIRPAGHRSTATGRRDLPIVGTERLAGLRDHCKRACDVRAPWRAKTSTTAPFRSCIVANIGPYRFVIA